MLALETLRSCKDEFKKAGDDDIQMENFSMGEDDFTTGNLLDDIDFDDLFAGIDYGDVLPDLEIDPDLLAEFSISTTSGGEEYSELNVSIEEIKREDDRGSGNSGLSSTSTTSSRGEEIVSKRDESVGVVNKVNNLSCKETNRSSSSGRKSSSSGQKSSQGKRKVKVDWTPELHRRFVQAVEQLGMDKAVPSRILELMGIDCLTRHNIASHLQKYRSHQKHLLAREAEAASWSQRRQIYGSTAGGRGTSKRELINNMSNTTASSPTPWIAPTMGFPPPPPPPHHPHPHHPPNLMHHHPFRPLHVWGHPTSVEHHQSSSMHLWPKHLVHHSAPQRPRWTPPPPHPPPPDSSYWHHQRGVTPGTPCFNTQPLGTARISSAAHPVPGIPPPPPHAMYKVDQGMGVVPSTQNGQQQSDSHSSSTTPFDLHPTKERIDAAIGDVLSKPWLPLPLGLKPPVLDSVMVELQRQGIPKIPPTTCAS